MNTKRRRRRQLRSNRSAPESNQQHPTTPHKIKRRPSSRTAKQIHHLRASSGLLRHNRRATEPPSYLFVHCSLLRCYCSASRSQDSRYRYGIICTTATARHRRRNGNKAATEGCGRDCGGGDSPRPAWRHLRLRSPQWRARHWGRSRAPRTKES